MSDSAVAAIADSLNADLKSWMDPSHAKGAEMNHLRNYYNKIHYNCVQKV